MKQSIRSMHFNYQHIITKPAVQNILVKRNLTLADQCYEIYDHHTIIISKLSMCRTNYPVYWLDPYGYISEN